MDDRVDNCHVTLRDFELSDVDDFMVWATDGKVANRFCSWEPYKSREQAELYIKSVVISHPWFKAICVHGKPVGSISISRGDGTASCRAEIGYALASNWWGKGIATQAVRLALSTAFRDLPNLERIEGLVEPENLASQRVLEKAGFVKEGLLCKYLIMKGRTRDFYIYRFCCSDLHI
uniref:N-acetyltransferase domain-containing protein n=1 Tax=Araucaria cunninghamii TaxID=56994 RepID=A0A0D6QWG4_ARACU